MVSKRVLRRRRQVAAGAVAVLTGIGITAWASEPGPFSADTSAAQAAAASPEEFLARVIGPAQAGDEAHDVPASVAIAQAILESDWANSTLTKNANALFGIKCGESPYVAGCVDYPTTECNPDGTCYTTMASFRAYESLDDSFRDHGHFLRNNSRYAAAFDHIENPDRFAEEIAEAGYATDPAYAAKLITLMGEYDLYQYND